MSARALRLDRSTRALTRVAEIPPVAAIGGAILAEWLVVLALALVVRHNGWIYYQGGDQLWYFTLGNQLAHGALWQTPIGYLWSFALAPFALVGGANLAASLPAIVLLNVLVLLPLTMFFVYGIAARIAGRAFAYWTLLVWLALPFVGILYTNEGYHQRYTELLLPQGFGLTAMADFPTMTATSAMLYFATRAVTDAVPRLTAAAAAGAAAGAAIALKPSAAPLLAGPLLAFAVRRRYPAAGVFLAALLPAVIALAVWKSRGLGTIPLLGAPGPHGAWPAAGVVAGLNLERYFGHLSWGQLARNIDLLREHFWSGHLVVWAFLAGLVGIGRRSWTIFAVLAGSALPFVLLKASYPEASIEDGSLFRILIPAYPVFVLAIASLPFLFPGLARRADEAAREALHRPLRARPAVVVAVVALTALCPAVVTAAADTSLARSRAAIVAGTQMPVPVDVPIGLRADTAAGSTQLAWDSQDSLGGRVIYRIWRMRRDGLRCPRTNAAPNCTLRYREIGTTREPVFDDSGAPPGRWVYRIGVLANWLDDPQYGDVYFVSKPLVVDVG